MAGNIAEVLFWISAGLLVYGYMGYPLMAALIGGEESPGEASYLPGISVLVPAYNEAAVIAEKITNFEELDYPTDRIEMIIVDDGSVDGTSQLIRDRLADNIRLLEPMPRAGKATGLNRMVRAARHDFLLLCDANVMFASDAARRLVAHMEDQRVGAVTGKVHLIGSTEEIDGGESLYYILERRIQSAESRIGSLMGVDGGMYLMRKELFEELPSDTTLDDFFISMSVMRSGYRIVYDGAIQATECGTPSSKQEFNRRVRMMTGVVQLLCRGMVPRWNQPILWFQFVSHKLLRWLTPGLLILLVISNSFILNRNSLFQFTLLVQLLVYLVFACTLLIRPLRSMRAGSVVYYFFMSQIAMVVGICKGLLVRQDGFWEKGERSSNLPAASDS